MRRLLVTLALAVAACQRAEPDPGLPVDPTTLASPPEPSTRQAPPDPPGGSAFVAGPVRSGVVGPEAVSAFDNLGPRELERLRSAVLFFGHQSVGKNIVEGAEAIGFPFHAASRPLEFVGVRRGETLLPDNGEPSKKIRSFVERLNDGLGERVDAAAMKLCWIDFDASTDVERIEKEYASAIDGLAARYPKLRIVHVTPPLTSDDAARNVIRLRYGDWIKKRYGAQGVVFDLASVISTNPAGGRCAQAGVPSLCDALRSDSGHLSREGSQRAAKAFLYAFARALGVS